VILIVFLLSEATKRKPTALQHVPEQQNPV
jgi:hypothetical protein